MSTSTKGTPQDLSILAAAVPPKPPPTTTTRTEASRDRREPMASGATPAPAGLRRGRPGARRHCPPGRSCGRSRAPPGRSARRPDLAEPGTQSLQSPALPGRAPAGREWLLPRRAPRPERRALHLSCREKGSEGFTNRALLLTSQVGRLGG